MENKIVNVVVNIDKNYVNQASVTITSICENLSQEVKGHFYVFCHDFIEKPHQFEIIEEKYGAEINCIDAREYSHYFKEFSFKNAMNFWVSPATFDRLLMFNFLPQDVERAIYIDCDIVVDKDLSKAFFEFDDKKLLSSVVDIYFLKFKKSFYKYYRNFEEFSLWCSNPYKYPYFCAGFFIANIKLGKEMNVFDDLINIIKVHNDFKLADQDALNAIFSQKYHSYMDYLPLEYDVPADANPRHYMKNNRYYYQKDEIKKAFKNPIVIHYAGMVKPWKNYLVFNYGKLWWKYYHISPAKLDKIPHFRWYIYHFLRKIIY